ncbi:2-C-methyl-D-erythritol 4-phosphate cytidylyltransferase/2-C-methyl-D-erythritol 2 [Elusimicrobium posterum]|uniref:2-C-methyl-D-erythritol 4-phosphate cytidylyltransferase n=1 Tax=Elusimicrobium posterum TaxID=3116653 RepID=UPI003C732607
MSGLSSSVIIVAGGAGTRMGRPKQMLDICGQPCLIRSIKAFKEVKNVSQIIVVSGADVLKEVKKYFPEIETAPSGDTRIKSVINGFSKVSKDADAVAVHDGARPLVNPADIEKVLKSAYDNGAALLAVAVKDTIKEVKDGVITNTPERSSLYAAQTPQCYRREILAETLEKYGNLADATDESQLVEKLGVKVHIVDSDYKNIKITTPEDLLCAEAFLNEGNEMKNIITRTGLGFDLHRLEPGRPLYIGGLKIEHTKGFLGHSDGDVVLHTICDAALGAICAGEIGVYFPPTDEKIKGISSVDITYKVLDVLKEHKAKIVHIDATIITEEPKMKPHYAAVKESLNKIFNIGLENISFKSKSHEKVGEIGAGNAAMCQAVVTVEIEK